MTADVEGTAEEVGGELVPHQPPPQVSTNLFHTDDPVEVVAKASTVAGVLKDVLTRQGMIQRIQGRDHVKVEGWTTLGAMLGVVPVVEWSRPVPNSQRDFTRREKIDNNWVEVKRHGSDWEARVTARTLDGRTIGAAESSCTREETTWATRDDYALRSMAQTRATSKALGGPLRFIVTLAGYEGTPAEEMPSQSPQMGPGVAGDAPTDKQLAFLRRLLRRPGAPSQDELKMIVTSLWGSRVTVEPGWTDKLNRAQVSGLIEAIKDNPIPTGGSDLSEDAPEHAPVDEDGQELFSPEAPS